jgi:hypothetical protein
MPEEVAKKSDLDFHLGQDWKVAHDIWKNAKNYVDNSIPVWVEDVRDLSITSDGNWHELTINTNARIAVIGILWDGAGSSDWIRFYTRKKGSSSTFEGIVRLNAYDGGGMITQPCDSSGKLEYYCALTAGSVTVRLIGYWRL